MEEERKRRRTSRCIQAFINIIIDIVRISHSYLHHHHSSSTGPWPNRIVHAIVMVFHFVVAKQHRGHANIIGDPILNLSHIK
jgi:hypothetical protein